MFRDRRHPPRCVPRKRISGKIFRKLSAPFCVCVLSLRSRTRHSANVFSPPTRLETNVSRVTLSVTSMGATVRSKNDGARDFTSLDEPFRIITSPAVVASVQIVVSGRIQLSSVVSIPLSSRASAKRLQQCFSTNSAGFSCETGGGARSRRPIDGRGHGARSKRNVTANRPKTESFRRR